MTTRTEEEILAEELSKVRVHLNQKNEYVFQITCTREILGGYGMARSYASEDVRRVLLSFGIEKHVIDDRMDTLRGINLGEIRPMELVDVGPYRIPNEILLTNGFTAV